MKVYVVIGDAFNDWGVSAVFDSKQKAEEFLESEKAADREHISAEILEEEVR